MYVSEENKVYEAFLKYFDAVIYPRDKEQIMHLIRNNKRLLIHDIKGIYFSDWKAARRILENGDAVLTLLDRLDILLLPEGFIRYSLPMKVTCYKHEATGMEFVVNKDSLTEEKLWEIKGRLSEFYDMVVRSAVMAIEKDYPK